MNPRTFLRSLLLLPIVVPLSVGGLVMALHYAGVDLGGVVQLNALVLMHSLVFGGIPYLVTAALVWRRIGRCGSRKSAFALMFAAPLVFTALLFLAALLWSSLTASPGMSLVEGFMEGLLLGLIMSIYGLVFGYTYAAGATVIFLGADRLGFVSAFAMPEETSR